MKATLRVPTNEQYAYIEVSVDGTVEEIVKAYFEVSTKYWKEVRSRKAREDKRNSDEIERERSDNN